MIFLGHTLSANRISANPEKVDKVRDWPEKVDKVRDWPVPKMPRNCIHSYVWHLTIASLSQTFLAWPNVYTN